MILFCFLQPGWNIPICGYPVLVTQSDPSIPSKLLSYSKVPGYVEESLRFFFHPLFSIQRREVQFFETFREVGSLGMDVMDMNAIGEILTPDPNQQTISSLHRQLPKTRVMQVDSAWWKSRATTCFAVVLFRSHLMYVISVKNHEKKQRETVKHPKNGQRRPNLDTHLSTDDFSFTISTYCWQAESLPPVQGASACQRKGVFQKDLCFGDFGSTHHAPIWVHWLSLHQHSSNSPSSGARGLA